MFHSRKAATHEENRNKVCIVCFRKGTYNITDSVKERIRLYFMENISFNDSRVPAAICGNCRAHLLEISQGKKLVDTLPESVDTSTIVPIMSTRNCPEQIACSCQICQVARSHLKQNMPPKSPVGRRLSEEQRELNNSISTADVVKLCTSCQSVVRRGFSHKCNSNTLRENVIKNCCEDADGKTKDIVASKIIQEKMSASSSKQIILKTEISKSLVVTIGGKKTKVLESPQLSDLQISLGASNVTMNRKIMPFIRNALGRSSVAPETDVYLKNRDKELEPFFSVCQLDFEETESSKTIVNHPVVYCNDLKGLIDYISTARGIENANLKLGIDGGGGFVKFSLSLYESDVVESSHGSTWNKGFLNTGVKRIIIIAIIPEMKETYKNVSQIFNLLNLLSLDKKYTLALDMKMANIVAGIQSHACSYPCIYCICPKTEFSKMSSSCILRTLESVSQNACAYKLTKNGEAKDFKSCVNEPLISGAANEIFLKHIPPAELHLLLRLTNKMFNEIEKRSNDVATQWVTAVGIKRPMLHSGEFTGNMCKRLLHNTQRLMDIISQAGLDDSLRKFVVALDSFNKVCSSCFGMTLAPSFEQNILDFQNNYLALGISVTSAAHIVFKHVTQFCRLHKARYVTLKIYYQFVISKILDYTPQLIF